MPIRFRYFTETNESKFNKDKFCEGFDECFSDFVILYTMFSGLAINKEEDSPIKGATVEFYGNNTLLKTTTRNSNGYYEFLEHEIRDYFVKIKNVVLEVIVFAIKLQQ